MEAAVLNACSQADVLLMAAAVADYRPTWKATQKIKKDSGIPNIDLEPTSDILQALWQLRQQSGCPKVVVGFAAETQDLLTNALSKLKSKHLDLIVANNVTDPSSGFEVDTNEVTLLFPGGQTSPLPLLTKSEVAEKIVAEVVTILKR
jgi:phosphopantothenoylcysteine decarboxylase/phosphopantothenate--cysteine ligase